MSRLEDRELPTGWTLATINDVAVYVQRGKSPKYINKSELPVVNQKCVRWDRVDPEHLKFVHPQQWDKWSEERSLRIGDILWNSTGTGTIGRAAVFNGIDGYTRVVADSHVTVIRVNEYVPKLLHYWIRSPEIQNRIESMQSGTTNQVELSKGSVLATPLLVPPLDEQRRIADKLDAVILRVQSCRERLDRVHALLKSFRQSVLAAATSGRLTEDWRHGSSNGRARTGENHGWREKSLSQLCLSDHVITYGVIKLGPETVDGVPCLRTSNVRWLRIETEGLKRINPSVSQGYQRTILQGGEVLVNVRGTLGGVAVAKAEMTGWNVSREIAVVPVNHDEVNPYYLAYWIGSRASQAWLSKMKKGVAYVGINLKDLRNLPVSLPPLDEQQEIVARVQSLHERADAIELRVEHAHSATEVLEPALLAKAFRGELVPQDPNDEHASVLLDRIRVGRIDGRGRLKGGKTARRKKVAKFTTESLKALVSEMPEDHFTFDELRSRASTDYESLRDTVFTLLADSSSGFHQVFDSDASEMRFVRTES